MSDAAHLEASLAALAVRLRREVEVMRALRSPARRDHFLGLILGEDDAANLCDEIAGRIGADIPDGLDAAVAAAEARVAAERARAPGLAINRLARRFGLDPLAVELLFLAAAPAIDARFGLVYGFLADDMARRLLTPGLAQRLLADRGVGLLALREACAPGAPLRQHALLLAEPADAPHSTCALVCYDSMLDLLMGRAPVDRSHGGLVANDVLDPALVVILPAIEALPAGCLTLDATPGADPVLWAMIAAARAGRRIRRLDWERWQRVPESALPVLLAATVRDLRIEDATPFLRGWEKAPVAARAALARHASMPLVLTGPGDLWNDAGIAAIERRPVATGHAVARALWASAITRHIRMADTALAAEIAGAFTLGIEEIETLAAAAARDGGDFAHALRIAVRRHAGRPLAELAERLDTPHAMGALVLPAVPLAVLSDVIASRATGARVLEDWGLGRAYGRRPGLVALFAGPPGTGKTMAAGVVAHMLGIDLFRIDLSGVVSKYIGETERNLERIFAAAERSTAVLFFDEADALFGKRSEVQDAHDRYANIEVSYLLQRIERFDGVAILATNLKQNLDEAFLRRIDFVVDFPAPQAADRLRLWRKLGETDAPLAQDIDFALLAERYDLTGGAIRNCAIAAAHQAAREETSIAMRHLVAAVAREYVKQGQPLRKALFGDLHAIASDAERAAG